MKTFLNAVSYLVVFLLIQYLTMVLVGTAWFFCHGDTLQTAFRGFFDGRLVADGQAMVLVSAVASLLTIAVFVWTRWSPFSRGYVRTRPWATLVWVVLLACGTVIPSEWLLEQLGVEMSEQTQRLFEQIMKQPTGYAVLGILVPVAEEMVFRGAVLRELLSRFPRRWHWLPIAISALLFGIVHGNMAQFVHATLLGLLLGWLYYRTDSIVPGIVLHWVNNTIAYVLYNLVPQSADSSLLELLGGNQRTVWYAVACSLLIFFPALFQVATRTKKR